MNSGTNFKAAEADEEEKSSEEQKKKKKCISEFWNRKEKKLEKLSLELKTSSSFYSTVKFLIASKVKEILSFENLSHVYNGLHYSL